MNVISTLEDSAMDHLLSFFSKITGITLAFLAPIQMTLFAVGFLILADLISGMWAAKIRKEKITSNGLRNTVTKFGAYQLCIITAFVVEQVLVPELPIVKVLSAMIGITETKSFFENMNVITGLNVWDTILKKLHGKKGLLKHTRKKK